MIAQAVLLVFDVCRLQRRSSLAVLWQGKHTSFQMVRTGYSGILLGMCLSHSAMAAHASTFLAY